MVGGEDKDRVHVRYIHSGLDDGCREEDVVVVVDERFEPLFHLSCRELSVRRDDTCFRAEFLYLPLDAGKHLNAVIDDEDLSVTSHLQVDCLFDNIFVIDGDEFCLNGIAVGWWRSHDTQVACAK